MTTANNEAETPTTTVAGQVRAELGRAQMSARELARQTGRDPQYWWRRLNSQTSLNVEDLAQVAAVLDVSVGALVAPLDVERGLRGTPLRNA